MGAGDSCPGPVGEAGAPSCRSMEPAKGDLFRILILTISLVTNLPLQSVCAEVDNSAQPTTEKSAAMEASRKACQSNDARSCHALGERLGFGRDTREEAISAYSKACKLGMGLSCNILGNIFSNSDNAQDQLKGASFYRKACDLEHSTACDSLGYAYSNGRGISLDIPKAATFYRKACELGRTESCDSANVETIRKRHQAEVDNVAKAQIACKNGEGEGCYSLAIAHEEGTGTEQDLGKAASLYGKACDLGRASACMMLGLLHENGRGVPKSVEKATAAFAKGVPTYLSSCNAGHAASCRNLGNMYEDGRGVGKDLEKAISFYRKGCELGNKGACENVARMTPSEQ